jgi:alkaline phosphatase
MVPLFAYGPGSERFNGIQDNARVGQQLIELLMKKEVKN